MTLKGERLVVDGEGEDCFKRTLRVVLVFTCLTMVSARDLSNCKVKVKVNDCVGHDVESGFADLLEDLHGQLGGNRAAGN